MSNCSKCANKKGIGSMCGCDGIYDASCFTEKIIAINTKPLADWTLAEVKAECASREDCSEPTFCPFRKDNGYCRVGGNPHNFNLTEENK